MQVDEVEAKQEKVSSQFQNRLVGIIVLVALGVIFLPDILDGKKQHQEEQFAEIPLRPQAESRLDEQESITAIDLSEQQAQFDNQVSAQNDSVGQASAEQQGTNDGADDKTSAAKTDGSNTSVAKTSEPKTSEAKTSEAKTSEAKQTPAKVTQAKATESKVEVASSAYTLQLGSFKNADNVNALVKRLRGEGYRAYTVPQKPVDGQLTKVFVGPDISKSKLQKLQTKLDKFTGLKSAVVDYNPLL
ncbi:cell division protein DedD [Shewanella aegiceratis]|uniref:cell division protein DedD n=1 Tax=Shewanella aegiceratis TaxID=2864203 RepID=UPI001C66207B|nr:cell division protein DedD [Shewanella aegiceratis]QYJ81009.1 cell division protein DedD [Shewanella aegiceratis]